MDPIQIFLIVLVAGGLAIGFFLVLRKILSPESKITNLRTFMKTGNYKSAIKVAKDILAKDSKNTEAHFHLGESYYNQGKFELALIEFKSADKTGVTSKYVDESELRERLADLYTKFNKDEEALKEYALILKKKPHDYLANFRMGELFENKGQKKQAAAYYLKSVEYKKNYPPALLNLGVILYEFKRFNEAESRLERAIKLEPDNFKAYFYIGMINKNANNFKKALDMFEKATRSKDYKLRSLAERGMIYMLQAKYDTAVIELERALKNSEGESLNLILNVRYMLAACYENSRNITDAIKQWEKIYSVKPDFKNVSEKLATYQDLRMDDRMKDYMTATDEEFKDICLEIVKIMKFDVQETKLLSSDTIKFNGFESEKGWRNVKKKPLLFYIFRKSDPVEMSSIRSVHEEMKKGEIFRATVISPSSFTTQAVEYAKERPISLVDKNELQDILKKITF